MMKQRFSGFLSGCAATALALALGTTALAASGQVTLNFANVALDGETKITAGSTITAPNGQQVPGSILYTDETGGKTNYLPIRAISELLGVEVGYDSATKTVLLGDQGAEKTGGSWQRTVDGRQVTYESMEAAVSHTAPPTLRPTQLPEGWGLSELSGRADRVQYRFSGDGSRATFWCSYANGGSWGFQLRSEESVQNCRQVTVRGISADLYEEGEKAYLVWEEPEGLLCCLSASGLAGEDLIQMAQSVQSAAGKLPEYELTWMPEGYSRYERSVTAVAVQETWLGPDTSLTLLYAAEPLALPEGGSQAVEVNGADARYWGAEEPYEPSGSMTVNGEEIEGGTAQVGGVTITTGTIVGPAFASANTLAWTDPDTGLFFRLHGTADRETLLYIAEQVRK